jgi:agmatine/peptidylarginine deiminase
MTTRRLPAEWEPQSGIMLTWPHANTGWGKTLPRVEPVFAAIAAHASLYEKVLIVAHDASHQSHITDCISLLKPLLSNIIFAFAASNDSWARDHGPITVTDDSGELLLLDFQFNGWGEKYSFDLDNKISTSLEQQQCFSVPLKTIDFILEGGSIESDGEGTLLTTACLLTSSRNEGWTKEQIDAELRKQFNVEQIHWLHQGNLQGDDTDAHIDTLARFISPQIIMYVKCDDDNDPHFQPLLDMEQELGELRTGNGLPYELVSLPLPDPVYNTKGDRLPATYANFLIINNAVLLPVYDQPADQYVVELFEQHFPDRKIIPINCLPLIEQFGSLHCVTMQFPLGVLAG